MTIWPTCPNHVQPKPTWAHWRHTMPDVLHIRASSWQNPAAIASCTLRAKFMHIQLFTVPPLTIFCIAITKYKQMKNRQREQLMLARINNVKKHHWQQMTLNYLELSRHKEYIWNESRFTSYRVGPKIKQKRYKFHKMSVAATYNSCTCKSKIK